MDEELEKFIGEMRKAIDEHDKIYGDSWKTEKVEFLEQRLNTKVNEFRLTKNPGKLVSLANLSMLLYMRMKNEK